MISYNDMLKRAGIETVLTGRNTAYGLPEKGLTNGVICIYRPKVEEVVYACREHFGIDIRNEPSA